MNDHDHPLDPERRLVLLRGFLALGAGSLASCGGGASPAEAASTTPADAVAPAGARPASVAPPTQTVPVTQPSIPVPAWVPSVPGQAVRYTAGGGVLTNNFRDVAAPWMSAYYDTGIVDDYSGAVVFERLGSHGALVFVGGGHAATNSNQVTALTSSPTQLSFVRLSNPTAWSGSMASDQSTQSANSVGASLLPLVDPQWIDATPQVSAERAPPGIHSYAGGVALPSPGALGAYFCPTVPAAGVANLNTPLLTGGGAHTFAVDSASDPAANKWERAGSLPGYSSTGFQGPLLSAYVPTQGRVYYFIGNSGNKVRWFDLASGQHVEGSVNGFVMSDYNTGQVLYVPGRELLLYVCRNRSAQVEVQWMDVSVASPQQSGTAVLGQALDLDPFEVGKTSAWVASFWCPLSQRLNLGGVMVGGAFDAAMYEVEIPSALRSSWPVVRRPITGSANIDWGVWTWQQPMYVPAARAMILFQVANKAAGTADSVIVYRPYGT